MNVLNLGPRGTTLRVEPGQGQRRADGVAVNADAVVRFRRVVRLPSRFGEVVSDLLRRLGDGHLLTVAPGEAAVLWLNVATAGLEPGRYRFEWPLRVLDAEAAARALVIELEVSPVRLPARSRFAMNYANPLGSDHPRENRAHGRRSPTSGSREDAEIWLRRLSESAGVVPLRRGIRD